MKNILYTKHFNQAINEDINVILSPQFYWIKKIDIPMKSLKNAKEIAHSFFDLEGEYFFNAIKIDNDYFAIAIDKNLNLNIDDKYIKSIHVAQTEFFEYDCIKIDNEHYLQKIDNIIFCFPYGKEKCIELKEIINKPLSKYNFNFKNKILLETSHIFFFIISLILSILFIINGFEYKNISSKLNTQKNTLLSKYNLPNTSFEIDSILLNLENIDKSQSKIRKDIEFFSNIPLNKNDKVILLEKQKSGYVIHIQTNHNYDNYFSKKFKILNSSLKQNIYKAQLQ